MPTELYNFNDAARLLLSAKFKEAKTMKQIPHAYTLLETWEDPQQFYDVVRFIRQWGYRQTFFNKVYTYLDINGYQYWTMGAPIDETILINRAKIECHSEYDKIAEGYDELFEDKSFQEEDDMLLERLAPKGRVLDVGCGTGLFLDVFQPEDYVGIDPSQPMLDKLLEKHPDYADKIVCTPAESFYDLEGFDTIISLYGSASYIPGEHIERLNTLLKPGGNAYYMYYKPGYDVYTYRKTGIHPTHYQPPQPGTLFTNYQIVSYES